MDIDDHDAITRMTLTYMDRHNIRHDMPIRDEIKSHFFITLGTWIVSHQRTEDELSLSRHSLSLLSKMLRPLNRLYMLRILYSKMLSFPLSEPTVRIVIQQLRRIEDEIQIRTITAAAAAGKKKRRSKRKK